MSIDERARDAMMGNVAEYRALALKGAGENIARAAEILRLAAIGQLTDEQEEDIFGERATAAERVERAELNISRAETIINKTA